MKMKQLSIACAVAIAGVSGQAFALNPTQSAAAQVKLFISGSSAQQQSLGALAENICASGTIDVYGDSASPYKDYRSYSCTAKTTAVDPAIPASISGKSLLISERAKGGSIYGVIPVARSLAVNVMTVNATSCGTAAVGTIDTSGKVNPTSPIGSTYPLWSCTDLSATAIPDMGVSDVEPDMFSAQLNIDNTSTPTWYAAPYNASDAANLDIAPEIAAVFGIPVSNTIGGVANAVTNLSKSQVASIMSGSYTDWHQVNSAIPAGTAINICRRVAGSGTQAGTNAWTMGAPCMGPYGGNLTPLTNDGVHVFENASSGGVASCMNSKGNAIGLLGVETQPGGTDAWHFATIDGQTPSTANAAQGKYDFFVESTFQYRLSATGAVLDLMGVIRAKAGDPSVISSLGIPGVLALPTNGWMPTTPYSAANPVAWGSRGGHTCSATQLQF
jgi:ABC-type phosphate transport system substrate-binding protein